MDIGHTDGDVSEGGARFVVLDAPVAGELDNRGVDLVASLRTPA